MSISKFFKAWIGKPNLYIQRIKNFLPHFIVKLYFNNIWGMTVLMLMMMVIMIIAPVPTHPFVFRYYFGIKESLKGSWLKKAEL